MRFFSHWNNYLGRRSVVETVIFPVKNSSLGGGGSRDVGSIMLRDVGFLVSLVGTPTLGVGSLFPEESML